jgi:predicted nucleic acid-binding protein
MLDATFLIDHIRGNAVAVARFARLFEDGDEPVLCGPPVCEVETGLRPPEEPAFAALVAAAEFVQAGPAAARDAGRWRKHARRRGETLSLADAMIAAEAVHDGAAVLTRNVRHFALTPVEVLTY